MAHSGFDLKEFLDGARSEGALDSEGSFTVAQEKALTKLAQFALPNLYDWVLKIVQAAHGWECARLEVKQTRVATTFFLCPVPHRFPHDGDIVQSLKNGTFDNGGPVDTLSMALRSLVDQVGLSFVLASYREGRQGEPIYAGDDIQALSANTRREWSSLSTTGLRLTVSHFKGGESFTGRWVPTFSFTSRRDLAIAQTLKKVAVGSPTAVYLDGRGLTDLPTTVPAKFRPLALASPEMEEPVTMPWRFFDPRCSKYRLAMPGVAHQEWKGCLYLETLDNCFAATAYAHGYQDLLGIKPVRHHHVIWTRMGVPVQRGRISATPLATSFRYYVNGDHLRSDLSGLHVSITDEEKDRVLRELHIAAREVQGLPRMMGDFLEKGEGAERVLSGQRFSSEASELEFTAAGYSIFSESLRMDTSGLGLAVKRLEDWAARLRLWGGRKERFDVWLDFLEEELRRLKGDMQRADTILL